MFWGDLNLPHDWHLIPDQILVSAVSSSDRKIHVEI
jgi:hypothetical protein